MQIEFRLNDYIQAKLLLEEFEQDNSKALALFERSISQVNNPILFSTLLNHFIIMIKDEYVLHIHTIANILRYTIQYNNVYAFLLVVSLPRPELLLESIINLDKQETVLMLASLYSSIDILEMLLNTSEENINQKNLLGETVLHYAINSKNYFNKEKTIDYLLQRGADQEISYDHTTTLREKILEIKSIGRQRITFLLCYTQQYLSANTNNTSHIHKLSLNPVKNILRWLG
jgi:Ankyrin repeats (3 copies)